MPRRPEALALLVALAACSRSQADSAHRDAAPAKTEASTPLPDGRLPMPEPVSPLDWLAAAAKTCSDTAEPRSGRAIGHTSVVYKLELASGKKIAWKPNAKKVAGRYKGELAAYRLALELDLLNVIPACPRSFTKEQLEKAVGPQASGLDETILADGKIRGAAIPWIDGLKFWPLEKEPLATEMRGWLSAGKELPADRRDLARQASTLVAFDYLTGNWDRYSGENVGLDPTGTLVLFIDNDAAFMERPPADADRKNLARVQGVDRFSRKLVERLRALTAERLAEVLREEEPGHPLLSPKVHTAVWARVTTLREAIDAKVLAKGETETLFFP